MILQLVAGAALIATSSTPSVGATAAEARITAKVIRDEYGVPHIFADREEDAMFAVGYAQAEDRLIQILVKYKATLGELGTLDDAIVTRYLGKPLYPALNLSHAIPPNASDVLTRQGRYMEKVKAAWPKLPEQLRRDYAFFVAGIQQYMDEHPGEVPAWAPKLDPRLPVATGFIQQLGDAIDMGKRDCEASGMTPEASRSATGQQSNAWAVSPSRTRDKHAFLAFDPHNDLRWRPEYSIHAGGIEAYVGTDVGNFFPMYGHNASFAWGATSGSPDVADCYLVQVDPADPYRYLYDGKWKTMTVVHDKTRYRGNDTTLTFSYTDHNGFMSPVVGRTKDHAYVVSTPSIDSMADFTEATYGLFLTRSVAQFRQDLEKRALSPYEWVAADTRGDIFFVLNGRVPKRPAGFNWTQAVPGNTSATQWLGVRPAGDLAQLLNPKAGYIQANNTQPDAVTEASPLTRDNYDADMIYANDPLKGYFDGPRGQRAAFLLRNLHDATLEDMEAISQDQLWPFAARWKAALEAALVADPRWLPAQPDDLRRIVAGIRSFDGQAHQESVPAAYYYFWRTQMAKAGMAPANFAMMMQKVIYFGIPLDPAEQDVLLAGFSLARDEMMRRRHGIDRPLGDFFRIGPPDASYPIGGISINPFDHLPTPDLAYPFRRLHPEEQPLRLSFEPTAVEANGQAFVGGGPRSAFVIELSQPVRSVSAVPWGTSLDPQSAHYTDQARLVSERKFKRNHFTPSDIKAHAKTEKILSLTVRNIPF